MLRDGGRREPEQLDDLADAQLAAVMQGEERAETVLIGQGTGYRQQLLHGRLRDNSSDNEM